MLVGMFAFAFLFSGLACLLFLLQAMFVKGKRKSRLLRSCFAFFFMIGSLVGFSAATDHEAQDQGWASSVDKRRANEAGYTDPAAWAEVHGKQDAAGRAMAEAAAGAKAETDTALDDVVAFVSQVTNNLPSHFQDHGNMIPDRARMKPLAADVAAYAQFYWTVDAIESNCQFLGQRTNIELLAPDSGIGSWVTTAAMALDHPNHPEFLEIFEKFQTAVDELGEAAVCPAMYRLLGPRGSLMEGALDINGLIDPEMLDRWMVRVEDGVLWSSRDYCERRYYLEQEPQQGLHDLACSEAEAQDF